MSQDENPGFPRNPSLAALPLFATVCSIPRSHPSCGCPLCTVPVGGELGSEESAKPCCTSCAVRVYLPLAYSNHFREPPSPECWWRGKGPGTAATEVGGGGGFRNWDPPPPSGGALFLPPFVEVRAYWRVASAFLCSCQPCSCRRHVTAPPCVHHVWQLDTGNRLHSTEAVAKAIWAQHPAEPSGIPHLQQDWDFAYHPP
jgi:hypothetical protein